MSDQGWFGGTQVTSTTVEASTPTTSADINESPEFGQGVVISGTVVHTPPASATALTIKCYRTPLGGTPVAIGTTHIASVTAAAPTVGVFMFRDSDIQEADVAYGLSFQYTAAAGSGSIVYNAMIAVATSLNQIR